MGRFINADRYISTGTGILGCNVFAYCNNNPIRFEDSSGEFLEDADNSDDFLEEGAGGGGRVYHYGVDYSVAARSSLVNGGLYNCGYTSYGYTTSTYGKSGSKSVSNSLLKGDANTRVYLGIIDGKADYVGITYDIGRRQSQHGNRFDYLREITTEPITRGQARAIEQVMINNNPLFSNKINSISMIVFLRDILRIVLEMLILREFRRLPTLPFQLYFRIQSP